MSKFMELYIKVYEFYYMYLSLKKNKIKFIRELPPQKQMASWGDGFPMIIDQGLHLQYENYIPFAFLLLDFSLC